MKPVVIIDLGGAIFATDRHDVEVFIGNQSAWLRRDEAARLRDMLNQWLARERAADTARPVWLADTVYCLNTPEKVEWANEFVKIDRKWRLGDACDHAPADVKTP